MRLALLDHQQVPLPASIRSLPLEMEYRLRKRLPMLSTRRRTLRAVAETLAELEAELREQSRRL